MSREDPPNVITSFDLRREEWSVFLCTSRGTGPKFDLFSVFLWLSGELRRCRPEERNRFPILRLVLMNHGVCVWRGGQPHFCVLLNFLFARQAACVMMGPASREVGKKIWQNHFHFFLQSQRQSHLSSMLPTFASFVRWKKEAFLGKIWRTNSFPPGKSVICQ